MTTPRFLGASERNALNQLVFGAGSEKTDFSDANLVVGFLQARAWDHASRLGPSRALAGMQEIANALARPEAFELVRNYGVGTPVERQGAIRAMLDAFATFGIRAFFQPYESLAAPASDPPGLRAKILEMVDHPDRVLANSKGTTELAARVYALLEPFLDMSDDTQSIAARDAVYVALNSTLSEASPNRMKFLTDDERTAVRTLLSRDRDALIAAGDTTAATTDRDLMVPFFNGAAFFEAHEGDSGSGLIGHMVSAMCKPESCLIGSKERMDLGEVVLNCIEHLESLDDDRPVAIAQLRETYALPADDVAERMAP